MAISASHRSFPRIRITSGSLELLKWLALAAMIVDHVNVVFYDRMLPQPAEVIGRLAMPLFALVFGYNLARPMTSATNTALRLAIAAAIAAPVHAALFAQAAGWYPLNVLATFAVAALVIAAIEQGRTRTAIALFVVGGALVEYWWPGLALVIAAWAYTRQPGGKAAAGLLVAFAGLCMVNGNAWALLALVPLLALSRVDVAIPRTGYAILALYPLHLVALWLLAG